MIWAYIKADRFFPAYCPTIKNYKNKIRGKNGRGNPIAFTKDEISQIKKAIKKMTNELVNSA